VRVSRPGVFARIRAALRPEPTPPRRARVNAAWGGMSQHTPRLLSSFYAPTLSANQEVEMSIRLLRARARALVQNNGYAAGFVDECVSNIVGPQGIQLCAQNRRLDGELHTPTNDAIEAAWQQWAEAAEYVSADGRTAWVEMQGLIVRTIVVDGEAFYRERRGDSDNPFGYSIELIDPDLVDEHYTVRQAPNGNEIRMGVELDARGRAVAYHVWNRHPSEGGTIRVRVPATEMRHVFRPLRPGQVRGVPWFAPVLQTHAFLAMYEEAEVTAARWSAAKLGMWIPGPDADVDPNAPKQVPLDAPPGSIVEGPRLHVRHVRPAAPQPGVQRLRRHAAARDRARARRLLPDAHGRRERGELLEHEGGAPAGARPLARAPRLARAQRAPRRLPQLAGDGAADAHAGARLAPRVHVPGREVAAARLAPDRPPRRHRGRAAPDLARPREPHAPRRRAGRRLRGADRRALAGERLRQGGGRRHQRQVRARPQDTPAARARRPMLTPRAVPSPSDYPRAPPETRLARLRGGPPASTGRGSARLMSDTPAPRARLKLANVRAALGATPWAILPAKLDEIVPSSRRTRPAARCRPS
jgi:hypothetical protein